MGVKEDPKKRIHFQSTLVAGGVNFPIYKIPMQRKSVVNTAVNLIQKVLLIVRSVTASGWRRWTCAAHFVPQPREKLASLNLPHNFSATVLQPQTLTHFFSSLSSLSLTTFKMTKCKIVLMDLTFIIAVGCEKAMRR